MGKDSAGESDELQWMYGEVQHSAEGQAAPCDLPAFSSSCGPTLCIKQATTPFQVPHVSHERYSGDCPSYKDISSLEKKILILL